MCDAQDRYSLAAEPNLAVWVTRGPINLHTRQYYYCVIVDLPSLRAECQFAHSSPVAASVPRQTDGRYLRTACTACAQHAALLTNGAAGCVEPASRLQPP